MRAPIPHSRTARLALLGVVIAIAVALVAWHGPDRRLIADAFQAVSWVWVAIAVLINLISVAVRSSAWRVVILQAIPRPWPSWRVVFSAFCVGLLGNAALPGRVGELARVAVVTRHLRRRPGTWATIVGTVFAHRLFDVVAATGLVVYVLYTSRIPDWAKPALAVVIGVGLGLLIAAFTFARRHPQQASETPEDSGPVRRLFAMARAGLTVLRRPAPAVWALCFQLLGWTAQLFAVWASLRAFQIHSGVQAAALILLLMNVVTLFPFWPGNVGLLQAAIAFALLSYGVAYAHGFAFGIGLQAIEVSVGVGLGLLYLAREGFSFAMLRRMPEVTDVDVDEDERVERIA
ncbi:MAG TPA: lysylphosphatidylglycerol synthase transmembrane domain-containing protein [Gaiellaceae bacterium]|nr:lysylphosphatidylglycerol synthase transmembrane domain-containing protein [Gaiellaceae bacterium]